MSNTGSRKIVLLENHRKTKKQAKTLNTMGRYTLPWKSNIVVGVRYITVDENGMVYGQIIDLIKESKANANGPPLLGTAIHYTESNPQGIEEEIFTVQVWGLLTDEQFEQAKKKNWPRSRGRFLDEVVTDDPRYSIHFRPSDNDW